MITSSFCLLPGVGLRSERRFWREGLSTWNRLLVARKVNGLSVAWKAHFDIRIAEAQEHVAQDNSRYFATILPSRHQWRLYEWLRERALSLCGGGRQLGYRGGLKAIERTMGIDRVAALQGFSGEDAVRQWNRWRHQRDEQA